MHDQALIFESRATERDGVTVLKLIGPLILQNIFDLQKELHICTPEAMVFDLNEVPYMDSAGIGVLINYYVSAEKNGRRSALAAANERIDALLVLTKVREILRSFPTVEDAVASV
jgi:anti-sigma B factor antagonist